MKRTKLLLTISERISMKMAFTGSRYPYSECARMSSCVCVVCVSVMLCCVPLLHSLFF